MKKILTISLLLLVVSSFAQDFDQLVFREQIDCSTISEGSAQLFQRYYTESKLDSAQHLLTYWEEHCGITEPLYRARLLLSFKQKDFYESLLTENVFWYLMNYESRVNAIEKRDFDLYQSYKRYFGFIPLGKEFDNFTAKEFDHYLQHAEPQSDELLLCEHYHDAGDTIFIKLQDNQYRHTALSQMYYKEIEELQNMQEGFWALYTGMWVPTGNLKAVGIHPEFGTQFGFKRKRWNYGGVLGFKFLDTEDEYTVYNRNTDEYELTKHFFGGILNIFAGWDAIVHRAHELQLVGGFGFDGFDVIRSNQNNDEKSVSVFTPNLNLGFEYRFYLKPNLYLGLRAQYHIVDYTLNNVIDLKGHPFTVHLTIGGINNYNKHSGFKAMRYKFRK